MRPRVFSLIITAASITPAMRFLSSVQEKACISSSSSLFLPFEVGQQGFRGSDLYCDRLGPLCFDPVGTDPAGFRSRSDEDETDAHLIAAGSAR